LIEGICAIRNRPESDRFEIRMRIPVMIRAHIVTGSARNSICLLKLLFIVSVQFLGIKKFLEFDGFLVEYINQSIKNVCPFRCMNLKELPIFIQPFRLEMIS
jgi:hypothetical protein